MRRITSLIILILVLAAVSYGGSRYLGGKATISTDNAYTTGDIITISSQLNDTIMWVGAEEGDYVEAGQKIVVLAGGGPKNELDRAKSDLARKVQEVAALKQKVERRRAEVNQWKATYKLAQNEARRRKKLVTKGMVSKEVSEVAVLKAQEVKASLATAQERLSEAMINAGSSVEIAQNPQVRTAAVWVRGKVAQFNQTVIVAPVSGHIAKRFAGLGEVISIGKPLFQMVQLNKVWIEANFKETKLRHLRTGQPVTIHSDLYGDELTYHGKVVGIGTGTGAAFSLLPPQNATGNWLKIVQRVPVRIELTDEQSIESHPLPIGTSLKVKIDTSNRDGQRLSLLPTTRQEQVYDVYQYWTKDSTETADQIIVENLPKNPLDTMRN